MSTTTATQMSLTAEDVERLLNDKSSDSRVEVLDKVAANYKNKQFQPEEFKIAEQIFRMLMRDAEIQVRQSLAEQFKADDNIPRDIVVGLAKDVESVALPVLESSNILSEADLLQIVESSREVGKLNAIAERDNISSRLSDALIDTNYPQVVETVVKNPTATISDKSYTKIVSDFGKNEAIQSGLTQRATLPAHVAERLITMVSDSLAGELADKYDLDAETLRERAKEAREKLTLNILTDDMPDEEIAALISEMAEAGRLDASIIMSALCSGYLTFFEMALAQKAGIPHPNTQRLLNDKGNLGFDGLYKKTGLPDSMSEAVRALLRVVQQLHREGAIDRNGLSNRIAERLLHYSDGKDIDNLSYILALVRQARRK